MDCFDLLDIARSSWIEGIVVEILPFDDADISAGVTCGAGVAMMAVS